MPDLPNETDFGNLRVQTLNAEALFVNGSQILDQATGDPIARDTSSKAYAVTKNAIVPSREANGTEDTGILSDFFAASNGRLGILPPGTYAVTSLLLLGLTNTTIMGTPGRTFITGAFDYRVIRLLDLSNVRFYGIEFVTTYANTVEDKTFGAVYSLLNSMQNVSFDYCGFSAPNANTAGLNVLPRTKITDATAVIDGLSITNSYFHDIGRIATTVMDRGVNATNPYSSCRRFRFDGNRGTNLGTINNKYGMLLSLDGYGEEFSVCDNSMDNLKDIGIENIAFRNGIIARNHGKNFQRGYKLFSMDAGGFNADYNQSAVITGVRLQDNRVIGDATGSRPVNYFDMGDGCIASDNVIRVESSVLGGSLGGGDYAGQAASVRRCTNVRFERESWINLDPNGKYAGLIESVSKYCDFKDMTIDDAACTAPISLLSFSGSGTNRNTVTGRTRTNKSASGAFMDERSGANGNSMQAYDDANGNRIGFKSFSMPDADAALTEPVTYDFIDIIPGVPLTAGRRFNMLSGAARGAVRIRNGTTQAITLGITGGSAGDVIAAGATVTATYNSTTATIRAS